jgi:hypothetical protein
MDATNLQAAERRQMNIGTFLVDNHGVTESNGSTSVAAPRLDESSVHVPWADAQGYSLLPLRG